MFHHLNMSPDVVHRRSGIRATCVVLELSDQLQGDGSKGLELGGGNAPDDRELDPMVPMHDDVPHPNDFSPRYLRVSFPHRFRDLTNRLSNDDQLVENSIAPHRVDGERLEVNSLNVSPDRFDRVEDVITLEEQGSRQRPSPLRSYSGCGA